MSAFSNYLEQALINATLRGTTYTGGTVFIALYTSDPTDADSGVEVSDSAYVRQVADATAADGFDVPDTTGGDTANTAVITYPGIADVEIVVTHWAIFDAEIGGNMLYQSVLTQAKTLQVSDVMSFPVGSLTVTLA